MTLAQLEYFVGVARSGHLTQTAREMAISQPSLTQAINKLERELGFPLFERHGRRILLTREGSQFLAYAEDVVAAQKRAEAAVRHIYQENQGRIRFAHTEPLPSHYIPDLIHQFLDREENRHVRIESDVAGSHAIINAVREDRIDFGFCALGAASTEGLTLYPLFKRPFALIVSRNDPLSRMESVEPEDLIRRPCVSYIAGSAMDAQVRAFWDKLGMTPDTRYRASAIAIGGLVAEGLGWAFSALSDELLREDITTVPMPKLDLERETFLAVRAGRKHAPAAERFRKFVLSYNQQFQAGEAAEEAGREGERSL